MVKPLLPKEVTFRIMAILRRSYRKDAPLAIFAGSEIDFDRAEVRKAGGVLPLTAKEYEILDIDSFVKYKNISLRLFVGAFCLSLSKT